VVGVALVWARALERREDASEFQAQGPDAQKARSPTVFYLHVGTAKERKSDDLKARGVYSP